MTVTETVEGETQTDEPCYNGTSRADNRLFDALRTQINARISRNYFCRLGNLKNIVEADIEESLKHIIDIIEIIELSEKCRSGECNLILEFFDFVKGVANAFLCAVVAVADAFTAVNTSLGVDFSTAVAHSDCLCRAMFHTGCAACAFARVERYRMDIGIHHTILSSARNQ